MPVKNYENILLNYYFLEQLPFGINVVLLPMLLVFAAVIICIGLLFLTEKSVSISILGVFKFNIRDYNVHQRTVERNIMKDVRIPSPRKIINSEECNNIRIKVKPVQAEESIQNSEECNSIRIEVKPGQAEESIHVELIINKSQTEHNTEISHEKLNQSYSSMVEKILNEL